jgi:hypothetical protein
MSAPSPPPDNSAQVAQIQADSAAKQAAQERADALAHKNELSQLRDSSRAAARNDANSYFSSRGLDPSQYGSDLDSYINSIYSSISPTDENPGTYFKDAGQNAYNTLEKGYQTKNQSQINQMFAPNFETQRIPFTLDDPYLSSIESEQRSSADAIIKNMLDRGVITSTGYAAAQGDLDRQAAGVKSKLNEFGTSTIAQGQQDLRNVAQNAKTTAGTLQLGQQFDPNSYQSEADRVFNEFVNGLGTNIRSKVTGNLFNTTGLAALAGAAQGAGNTVYNPAAAAGVDQEDDSTQPPGSQSSKESIF